MDNTQNEGYFSLENYKRLELSNTQMECEIHLLKNEMEKNSIRNEQTQ